MNSKSLLLLPAVALACTMLFPSTSQAQAKREIATALYKPGYLFPLDATYYAIAEVPEKKAATDVAAQVVSFTVRGKFAQEGLHEIRDMKLQCQGVTYTVPARKILVLGETSKTLGLTILTAPDPNGSGNVELLVKWNGDKKPEPDYIDLCDYDKRPEGIEMIRSGASGGGADTQFSWYMEVILRNTTTTPYTLKPEFFKNVPPVEHWPEIVIPPAKAK